jgi:hypothetical protein
MTCGHRSLVESSVVHGALGCLSFDVSDDAVGATHSLTQHALELLMEIAEYNLKVC